MALIGTIRKNFWFVLILLGFALAAFILMDMTSAGNAGGVTSLTMGDVAGEKIDYRAFQQTESAYYGNSGADVFTKRKSIWDFYVQNTLLKKEASALGLNVSTDELMDLQFGANQSPIIQQNWRNPQTGQVDQANLQQFKTAIENGDEMNPQFRTYWAEQEKQIIKESLQSKLNTLVSKAIYTPNFMAEESHILDNTKVDFNYVKIPFDNIDASGIEVSDSDINSYITEKKDRFEVNVETREMEYVVFNVEASEADAQAVTQKVEALKQELYATNNDSLLFTSNNGNYSHLYGKAENLPEIARAQITALNPGEVYGPFTENGYSMLVKLIDKKKVADSVTARHILKAAPQGDVAAVASARTFIDSIRREYNRGVSFDTLALRHSDDTSNKLQGGDLGSFTQETMVPEFATACFANGRPGGVYVVTTQFGVHLLEVQDQVFNDNELKYRIASMGQPITPSQETQDEQYDKVTEIVAANRDINSLRTAIAALPDVQLEKSAPLRSNDFNMGTLGAVQSTRDIIQWAFDPSTEVGDVSPEIFRFTDPVQYYDNKYVLAALSSVIPKGLPTASSMRSKVEAAVMNRKKAAKFVQGFKFNSLQEAATSQGLQVQNAADVGSKSSTITGIGNEPKVLAAAFGTQVQATSQPIIGESGVYIVQPISRQEAGAATNLPLIKSSVNGATKSQVNFSLIKNMTKRADIKDDRATFF